MEKDDNNQPRFTTRRPADTLALLRTKALSRRRLLVLGGFAALAASCKGDATPTPAPSTATPTATPAAPTASATTQPTATATTADGVFPVTIEHKFGTTIVPAKPERVVVVGFHEQDWLYMFGVAPVGVREWFGDMPYATYPWADALRGDAQPVVMTGDGIDFETIAGLNPDLIVGTFSGMTPDEYAILAAIAPVVAQGDAYADWGMPWEDETRQIGAALGQPSRAEEIIAETEAVFAKVRAEHPEFDGARTAVLAYEEGVFMTYTAEDTGHRFLSNMGFVVPPEYNDIADGIYVNISAERAAELLDLDVGIWWAAEPGTRETIEALPIFQQLPLAKEGRNVWMTDLMVEAAMSFQTPLSFSFLVDNLVPLLVQAVDGDPAT